MFIEAVYRPVFRGGRPEIVITSIRLLESVGDTYFKSVTLTMPIEMLTKKTIELLHQFVSENHGVQKLKIVIVDEASKVVLRTLAHDGIAINQLLLDIAIQNGMEYQVEMN